MAIKDELIAELKHEATLTKKILERVPFDKIDWRPHAKSMTLGRLATHVAENTRWLIRILSEDEFDFVNMNGPHVASTSEELLGIFQKNLDESIALLEKAKDEDFSGKWAIKRGGQLVMELPKKPAIRGWALSHNYHHRGQLSVYLRLLDVPVPGMYGPSADER